MKFAQYLQDTQTPEWKKAYIDYRGLKKRITAIRKAQQGLNFHIVETDTPEELPSPPAAPRPSNANSDLTNSLNAKNSIDQDKSIVEQNATPQPHFSIDEGKRHAASSAPSFGLGEREKGSFSLGGKRNRGRSFSSRLNGTGGSFRRQPNPLAALPLHELLHQLSPHEVSFFTMLDAQLDKVESFYLAREKEMLDRGHLLQIQLNELHDHRKLFLKAHNRLPWATTIASTIKNKIIHPGPILKGKASLPNDTDMSEKDENNDVYAGTPALPHSRERLSLSLEEVPHTANSLGKQKDLEEDPGHTASVLHENAEPTKEDGDREHPLPISADPDSYLSAKRKLKRAVLEHYRGLEVLHNYRVLNITGFRKALKKFEKVTRISVQNQYMTEKVEKSAFASDKAIMDMMTRMEDLYALTFSRGDRKKAIRRLRVGNTSKSHHFSTFRSGLYLGVAIPALVNGLVKVFQEDTREDLPEWSTLLYLYGILLIPIVFSVLVGINLLVWARARINYVFIFELEVLSRLDYREYFEIPSILLSTLCYAFWLSFSMIGSSTISPTIWPLVWLAFAAVVVFDPLPLMYRPSRFWLIRKLGRQFMSGMRHVDFADFWMGDQFCSLIFTLSNIYTFICVYVHDFPGGLGKCSTAHTWGIAFALAAIPLFIRLVQSIKRYVDSRLITHLINGGKYGSGIVSYFFYFYWRHRQDDRGTIFALWCLFNSCYSIYACAWDLLMDWSFMRLHVKYPLLRPELVYTNQIYAYYFAIFSNIIIRFLWVILIPQRGPSITLRSFIIGFLEMLRRWQWNFFRLENEHLGNMDQYRVTREVPLPYSFDDRSQEDDNDDEDQHLKKKRR
ncbi:unnamed protein product [Cyclocybe aegerita]|uniref:Phosphate transporter PHO1 n=1 Tax=Cyclocybe aegerita TaxID=1973307 RepID=A0A8S0X1N3_CYCAE|nr:unnamed protein product [Cyclocybe aegerita]